MASTTSRRGFIIWSVSKIIKPRGGTWGRLVGGKETFPVGGLVFPGNPTKEAVGRYPEHPIEGYNIGELMSQAQINLGLMSIWAPDSLGKDGEEIKSHSETTYTDGEVRNMCENLGGHGIPVALFAEATALNSLLNFPAEFPETAFLDKMSGFIIAWLGIINGLANTAYIYDKEGKPRPPVVLPSGAVNRPILAYEYSNGLDLIAKTVHRETGVDVGFIVSPTPLSSPVLESNHGTFLPVEAIGQTSSILGLLPWMPYKFAKTDINREEEMITRAERVYQYYAYFAPTWATVIAGYDSSLIPQWKDGSTKYGYNQEWNAVLREMLLTLRQAGSTGGLFTPISAFTERQFIVHTIESGGRYFDFIKQTIELFVRPKDKRSLYDIISI